VLFILNIQTLYSNTCTKKKNKPKKITDSTLRLKTPLKYNFKKAMDKKAEVSNKIVFNKGKVA